MALTPEQVADYHRDGFLVLRQRLDNATLDRFATAAERHPPIDQVMSGQTWPSPGRWALARNAMADPDLAFLPARSEIVEPLRAIFQDQPKIIMFAYYDRTPGGQGLTSHNDYKRWRPTGSSMRWSFAIVPLCDYDEEAGVLWLAPGSHRVAHTVDPWAPVLNAERPTPPPEDAYVDPKLRRGDIVFVDMHTWHRAGPNKAAHHRTGMFAKFCAASYPPATGYFPYTEAVRSGLGPGGEHILGLSSDLPISTTRAVLERVRPDGMREVLYCVADDGTLSLPGGQAWEERAIPNWDDGNVIGSLCEALSERLQLRPPWMSWIADYDEGDHRCRVYGYRIPSHAWGVQAPGTVWLTAEGAAARALDGGFEAEAARAWRDDTVMRGKGVTQALGRADQYAC